MTMGQVLDRKITQSEFDTMTSPLELDLVAFFKVLEDDILSETFDADISPEKLIEQMMERFDTPSGGIQVQKEDRPVNHIVFQGMLVGIENPRGSVRHGKDPNGHQWEIKMYFDYGFIWNTNARDGDSLDCYLGLNSNSDKVFAIKQVVPDTGVFDEVKIMLGFDDARSALLAYRNQYDNPKFYGGMVEYGLKEFKDKIFGGHDAST